MNLKDDSELAVRGELDQKASLHSLKFFGFTDRAEKFDILAEFGLQRDELNKDSLMNSKPHTSQVINVLY